MSTLEISGYRITLGKESEDLVKVVYDSHEQLWLSNEPLIPVLVKEILRLQEELQILNDGLVLDGEYL
jgi:hypothetical protein